MRYEEARVCHTYLFSINCHSFILVAEECEDGVQEDIPPETRTLAELKNNSEIPSLELAGMLRGYTYIYINGCCLNVVTFTS